VKADGFGSSRREMLEDLAVVTGGRVLSEDIGLRLDRVELSQLGSARKIVITQNLTTVIGGAGDPAAIESRCQHIRRQLEDSAKQQDRESLRKRLARLSGGVAILRVGATTESEMKERQARVEDAFHATRAAVDEGIVPGGGVALLRTQASLEGLEAGLPPGQAAGVAVVRRALEEPLRCIAENAGAEGAVVVQKVKDLTGSFGYNAHSGEFEDLLACGVLDPTKVVRMALQNAASVAAVLLTTEAMVAKRES
jgi:chaperonin GroEL